MDSSQIAAIAAVIAALAGLVGAISSLRNKGAIQEVKVSINHRMDEMLIEREKRGNIEGAAQARTDDAAAALDLTLKG